MTKKKKSFDEYSPAKKEITEKVKSLATIAGKDDPRRTIRFPVDGCRNYELESDGTFWMQHGPVRTSHNKWTDTEWKYFETDCKNNLWKRIEAFINS
jgi:hypothetical protein